MFAGEANDEVVEGGGEKEGGADESSLDAEFRPVSPVRVGTDRWPVQSRIARCDCASEKLKGFTVARGLALGGIGVMPCVQAEKEGKSGPDVGTQFLFGGEELVAMFG